MLPVIGLCGNKGVGKDTVADIINARVPNVVKEAHAAPLKSFLRDVFGLTEAQLYGDQKEVEFELKKPEKFAPYDQAADKHFGCAANDPLLEWAHDLPAKTTPRHVMQTLGTEWGRKYLHPSVWSNLLWRRVDEHLNSGKVDLVVVPDVRFRNEALAFKHHNALLWRIDRAALSIERAVQTHQSESELQSIPRWWFNNTISNNATLDYLERLVGATLRSIRIQP